MKKRNGYPCIHFYYYGMRCVMIASHPLPLYTLEEWKSDPTLKQIFAKY